MKTPIDKILSRWHHLTPDGKVLVMASGGVDSMALLETARLAGIDFAVLHVTHDMRPEQETDADAFVVTNYCNIHGISSYREHVYSDSKTEGDYRKLRIQAILRTATAGNYRYVATGHHADDQIETILMKIARGCGIEGVRGISESKPYPTHEPKFIYVRPLLETPKEDLIRLCRDRGVAWHEDTTNQDNSITRNALRNQAIPHLRAVFPNLVNGFATLSENAESASEYIQGEVRKYVEDHEEGYDRQELLGKGSYFLYHWLKHVYTAKFGSVGLDRLSKSRCEEFIRLLRSPKINNRTVDFNGYKMFVTNTTVTLLV